MSIKRFFQTKSQTMRGNKSPNGFTLIEIIVVLIMVGVLAAVGGMAIVRAVQGYMVVRENSTTTQNAQLAMSRITKEILEMTDIPTNATATVLPLNNVQGNRIIGLNNGAVKIALDPAVLASGDILIDNVSAFTLTYYSGTTASTTWPTTNLIETLTAIDVSLTLSLPIGGTQTFTNRIVPRNIKDQKSATLPPIVVPPTVPNYSCFVATAAYGDPAHPMVQILRDFRDRYLLSWEGGRWFVQKYYQHGPAAADLIRNKPLAMWAVRFLLAPVVALSFCLLYAPQAILFIFLVALLVTMALFKLRRKRDVIPLISGVSRSRGSILVGLIITMVIMAVLAAAMLPMFSTSYMNQVYADQGRKAYFLAESGYRYAASQFLNAGSSGRDAIMNDLDGKTCNLLNNAGSFSIILYPYWFKNRAASNNATTLVTDVYGTIPGLFSTTAAGYIRINSNFYSYSSRSTSGQTITFSGISPALPATAAGFDVQPVTYPGSAQNLTKGGSLTLSATGSGVFPLLNGNFLLNPLPTGIPTGAVFSYTKRTGTILYNVTLADRTQNNSWTSSVSVPTTTKVVLDKFLQLNSRGTSGTTSRYVVYNIPLGWMVSGQGDGFQKQSPPLQTFPDYATLTANWNFGAGSLVSVNPDTDMAVNAVPAPYSGSLLCQAVWSIAYYKWTNSTKSNLAQAWMDAQGNLSYDLQVKVKNDQPSFFAGMGFRTVKNSDGTLSTYGVSFVKPRIQRWCVAGLCGDPWVLLFPEQNEALIPGWVDVTNSGPLLPMTGPNIWGDYAPNGIEATSTFLLTGYQYAYGYPAIVLWERTTAGCKWLAYRKLVAADGIVTNPSGYAWRLVPWSTLMVRVAEGRWLTFDHGGGNDPEAPIREGDVITNQAGTKSARVVMTPMRTGGTWNNGDAEGALILANIMPTSGTQFVNSENLYVNGVMRAKAQTLYGGTKKTYIRVYFSRPTNLGTANAIETDNNRLANPRDSAYWPPDDLNDAVPIDYTDRGLNSANDYVTLVKWTGYNSGVGARASLDQPGAIIEIQDLNSPVWTASSTVANFVGPDGSASSGDGMALITSDNVSFTYYDDFAMQLDLMGGSGFLPPIQQ